MNLALDPAVARKLDAYRRRRGRLVAFRSLCAGITALLIGLAAVALIDWYWLLSDSTRWLLSAAAYAGAVAAAGLALVGRMGRLSRREQVAAAIEDADPSVRERLLSAVELAADDPSSIHDSPAFRALLQGEVARLMTNVRPAKLLPYRLVAGWAAAAAIVIGLTAAAAATGGPRVLHLLHRAALPGANLARVSRVQVEIIEPSPPSRTLPAGDTVAIVVGIRGDSVDEALLEAAAADGEPRILPLRPTSNDEWAVNLPLGEEDVTYRVLAGDAITKRYTLTVRPRPRITAFGKTVAFPDYAALPPQTVTDEHGDLFALVGSTVELTLEPDQPVSEADLRLAPADPDAPEQTVSLASAEGDDGVVRWSTTLPMETPGTYRVHLVSAETGFDNPFAPRSEIRPLADAPPTVAFTKLPENAAAGLLLPPDDLLDLAASAADDLPLDQIEQWVSINGGEWTAAPLAFALAPDAEANAAAARGLIDAGGRELAAEWRWDLLPLKLNTGDEVRTKLVATDRKGQTGQSAVLRVLIAGEDFDPLRHASAERTLLLVDQVAAFAAALKEQRELADAAVERLKQTGDAQTDEANADEAKAVRAEEYAVIRDLRTRRRDAAAALVATIAAALPGQPAGADALEWELLGRFVSRTGLDPAADPAAQRATGVPDDQIRDAIARDFREADEEAVYAEKFARRFASHGFFAAVAADLAAVFRQQDRVANLSEISWDRLARQEAVVAGRLEAVEEFARRHRDRVEDKHQREVDGLIKATDELRTKLDDAAAQGADDLGDDGEPSEEALRKFREAARGVRDDLAWRKKPNTLHNLSNELRSAWKYLWEHTGDLPDQFDKAAEALAKRESAIFQRAAAGDSAEADRLREEIAKLAADPDRALAPDVARLRDVRTLQKARPDADTVFAADAGLAARAVAVVADAAAADELIELDPVATNEEPADGEAAGEDPAGEDPAEAEPVTATPSFALREIAPAFRTLQSGHELTAARRAAETLRERERWGAQTPDALFDHPRQWDAHEAQLEYALDRLRRAKALGEGNVIEREVNEARWSPAAQRAEPLITERRWKEAGPVAADAELAVLAADLRAAEAQLAPTMAEARAVLAKYAPTIPELAREAAEAARQREDAAAAAQSLTEEQAAEAEQTEPEAAREAVRELAREQAAAERDLAELAEALADDADRQDLRDAQQRDRAKDADAAVAAVQERAEAAEDALADAARAAADETATPEEQAEPLAEAAEQQAATAEALERVAEHFENLDSDATPEEIAESREALRELVEQEAAAALEERFAPSEALAEAAAGDPQALLEQLEAELAVNPAMQEALSDIAADAAADAQNTLEESVEQEQNIQRDLDRSDEAFQKKKADVAENLRELARAADLLSNRAANTARQAADRGQAEEAEESLNEAREALAEAKAATQSANADAPLPELAEAAQQAGEALDRAVEALAEARGQAAAEKGNKEIHKDDGEWNRRREEMERDRKRLREAQERDARDAQKRAEDAERRAEDARRKAEDAKRKAEDAANKAQREAQEAENQAKKAQEEAAKEPDDAGRAQRAQQAAAKAEQAAAKAEQAKETAAAKAAENQAAEQARDAAKAETAEAKQATEAVRKLPNPRLDAANPAAELAEQLAGEAQQDAKALQEQAAQIAAAADFNNELNASAPALAQSEQRQQGVTERVAAAASDLERAARHEERLGQPMNAEPLANAARAVKELAEGESTAAQQQLAAAAAQAQAAAQAEAGEPADPNAGEPDPQADVAAREAVGAAEAALANEAQALAEAMAPLTGEGELAGEAPPPGGAEMAAAGDPAAGEAPAGAPQAGSPQAGAPQSGSQPPPRQRMTPEEQARGRNLARQLDAIDRAMNAPPAPAPTGEGEAVPTPADAAAELFAAAAAAESAAVSAARAAQAAQAAPPAPGQPALMPGPPAAGAAAGMGVAEGAGGEGGNVVRPEAVTDKNWANLRRKDAEDVSAGRSAAVSEEYRDSVNAYFRVLAERARQGDR